MENLIIVQHWEMLCYVIIWGGGYWLQAHKLHLGNYMYLHKTTVIMQQLFCMCRRWYFSKCYYWRTKMVKHGKTMCISCILCHLPNVDTQSDPSLFVVHVGLCYNVVRAILRGNHYIKFMISVLKDDLWDVLRHHWRKY